MEHQPQLGLPRSGPSEVKSFLRRRRSEILAEWRVVVRRTPISSTLPGTELVDHIPELLDELANLTEDLLRDPDTPRACEAADLHALDRIAAGFDISSMVQELAQLRRCILTVWQREHDELGPEGIALDLALDQAIACSVARFLDERQRSLAMMAELARAAAAEPALDVLLQRVLEVYVHGTPLVDVAAILLAEGSRLRLRAAVGLARERIGRFAADLGDGFLGRVAAERRPSELEAAYLDPLVRLSGVRDAQIRALYGVPIVCGEELLGVAIAGSRTKPHLPPDQRELLGALAALAAGGIHDHAERQRLLSMLSHDLRNPLGAVELSSTMLLTQLDDHRARKHLEVIQRSCLRMEHLVDDLVDCVAIQGGRLDLARERLAAEPLVAEALELASAEAADQGIALRSRGALDDAAIDADRDRLLQALGNLVRFALRRCHAGDAVTLAGELAPGRVHLVVADTGPTLDRRRVAGLFEPAGADGIALYIARGIVEAHDGKLDLDLAGPGARFLVSLPRAP